MTFGSLFSGIGGMDLGLERAGFVCKWQVEVNDFAGAILQRHWPNVPKYGDITQIRGYRLERVDLIAGGFPCQDLSVAGKRAGITGKRSGLWSEFARLIGEIRPRFVLIENVSGLLDNEPMRRVLGDLSALRFDAEWRVLPARSIGAPHERQRLFIVAYSNEIDGEEGLGYFKDWPREIFIKGNPERSRFWLQASNLVARMGDGVPKELYKSQAEGLGNAVVPQVAEWIGRRILEAAK